MKNYRSEVHRTLPDYIVYVPKSSDRSTGDTGNEHFLVERLGGKKLLAVWTRSSYEGASDQHIIFATSKDDGATWSAPREIAGRDEKRGIGMASWAFPMISKSGRIYVIYSRHVGKNDVGTHTTGLMACIYSDNEGKTWSEEAILPMPRSVWDNKDKSVPSNWIVWQKPGRLSDGRYFTGFTRWVSPTVHRKSPRWEWWGQPAVVEFMRFENIDNDPKPEHLEISFLCRDRKAIQLGLIGAPDLPAIQEPSWVELPDGRLFCIMRTTLGSPYYILSSDKGKSWTPPEPLRQHDDGPILPHPCSPCPIYPIDATNFIFFYHNHDGNFLHYTPSHTDFHRRPICLARGEYRPGAKQPVWFSEPWYFMDNGGVALHRADLAMYASIIPTKEGIVFWYPDRKFFLLGKKISTELITNLPVPKFP